MAKPSFANIYDAIDAAINKLGLKRGGSPIALASRLVLDDDGNVCQPLITKKTTISLADLKALGAVTSGDITTDLVLPASSVVFFATIKQSTSLAGGTVSAATAQLKTANNNYGAALDVFQAVGDTVLSSMTTVPKSENFSAVTPVKVGITLTGGNASTLTAGQIDLWVHYKVRP